MPYHLEQSGSGYYVVGPRGRHSKHPMPRRRAAAQMRALYAAEKDDGAMLHGPGGLLATPGLGKRKGRKWGNRTKDAACTCTKEYEPGQLCPYCTADLALPDVGWYRCGNCHEVFYAADTDSDYEDYHAYRADRASILKSAGAPLQPASMPTARVLHPPRYTTKAESLAPGVSRIHGDLCNVHGRYGSCSAAGFGSKPESARGMQLSRATAPKAPRASGSKRAAGGKAGGKGRAAAKPKKVAQTPAQRAEARQQQATQNRADTLAKLQSKPNVAAMAALGKLEKGEAIDPDMAAALAGETGLVEQHADGSASLTATGRAFLKALDRGDAAAAEDVQGRAQDQLARTADRQQTAADRKRAADQRRADAEKRRAEAAKKRGGGGKRAAPKGPTPEQQQREAERKQRQAAADQRRAESDTRRQQRDTERTARQAAADARRQAADQRRQQNERRRQTQAAQREETRQRGLTDLAQRMEAGNKLSDEELQKLIVEGLAQRQGSMIRMTDAGRRQARRKAKQKSFTVFKDASGAYRWVLRTTTAYRDRDGEIITTKALEADAQRMTATGQYGPLRYWHIGQPNPFDPVAPWGAGLDIGDCDYSTVIGRTSVESGTFKSAAIGQAFATSADDYEVSPGFFHPPDQPNTAGEYDTIRRFERSTVPIKYGRASNLFTGMTVKEHRMDQQTYEARVRAFMADMHSKGVPPEVAAATLGQMEQADKSATQQGIAYKSDQQPYTGDVRAALGESQPVYIAADGTHGMIINGLFTPLTLKAAAAPPVAETEKAPPMMADAETPDETTMEGGMEEPGEGGEYIGDLTPSEFWGQLTQVIQSAIAPALKMDDMHKKMGDMLGELKSMYTTKDAGVQARIAQLEAEIATLKGDQPAIVESEALAALKSKGPQAPPSADAPQIPDDPSRPLAGLTAALLPRLYGGAVQGFAGANGWQLAQPPQPNTGGN